MKANCYFGSLEHEAKSYKNVYSPYDGSIVSHVSVCDKNDALNMLNKAQKAFLHVRTVPLHRRINWLLDVAKKLEQEEDKIARILCEEVGKPIRFARVEVQRCIETIRLSAYAMQHVNGETFDTTAMPSGKASLSFYLREPVGVVLAITPFNFPLNLVAHKIAPALVAGNCVILKPTSQAPRTAYALVKLFIESPYASADALSLIYSGEGVNDALVRSEIPRVISFTGSVSVGREITQKAGIKKIALELGGNAATYIDASADLSNAVKRCAMGAFINSGQVCISLQRIYVHEAVYETFANALKEETQCLPVGSPYEETTYIGPMVNEAAVTKAKRWVQSAIDEGAHVLCGFTCQNLLMAPTIMTHVTDSMKIVCEEVFAPIVSLVKVADYEEAKVKMNASGYGLQYSIFTNDLAMTKRAIDELEAGGIVINDVPTLRFDQQPYGGIKHSGIGKEGPYFALLEDYTQIKSVVIC